MTMFTSTRNLVSYGVSKDRIFSSSASRQDEAAMRQVVNDDHLWKEFRKELAKNRAVTSAAVVELSHGFLNTRNKRTQPDAELRRAEQIRARRQQIAQEEQEARQSTMMVEDFLYPTRGFANIANNNNVDIAPRKQRAESQSPPHCRSRVTVPKPPANLMDFRKSPGEPIRQRKRAQKRHSIA